MSLKVYFSTSEISGELYSRLIAKEILKERPDALILGAVKESGAGMSRNAELAPVGFAAGARRAPDVLGRIREIERDVRDAKPDIFLAVAWSEPNTILGLRLRDMRNMKRVFFAPPQLWAWGKWRASLLKKGYHLLLALYPREALFLRRLGLNAQYAGNPLASYLKTIRATRSCASAGGKESEEGDMRTIALLPGSRLSEKRRNIPLLERFVKEWRIAYPRDRATWLFLHEEEAFKKKKKSMSWENAVSGEDRYRALASSSFALVTSGTASLETALLGIPQVVFYTLSAPELALAKALTNAKHFALPNIILSEEAVPELLNPSVRDLVKKAAGLISFSSGIPDISTRLNLALTPLDKSVSFLRVILNRESSVHF